jgi:hypothetical protein
VNLDLVLDANVVAVVFLDDPPRRSYRRFCGFMFSARRLDGCRASVVQVHDSDYVSV